MYFVIKHVHVTCVVLSACGFLLRGYWMVSDSRWLKSLPARVMPHIIDSTLLISAIALAVMAAVKRAPSQIDTSLAKQGGAPLEQQAPATPANGDPLAGAAQSVGQGAEKGVSNGAVPLAQ